jgi:hypothetical protein
MVIGDDTDSRLGAGDGNAPLQALGEELPERHSAGDTPLVEYGSHGNKFSGDVNWVQIDLEKDDHGHLISPEERFKVAMARQ